jgi:hypothetical protein
MYKYLIILIFANCLPLINHAQQKEVFIDYSSSQKPDSSYKSYKKRNPIIVDSVSINQITIEASSIDSIKNQIMALRKDLDFYRNNMTDIQLNLDLFYKKYRTGTYVFLGGFVAYLVGSYLVNQSINNNTPITGNAVLLFLGGLGATASGIGMMISSNKYIGKAGNVTRKLRPKYY